MSLENLFARRWDELRLLEAASDIVCPDSTPVLFFGDIENARVVTVGINPSWKEFCVEDGSPLQVGSRRFMHSSDLNEHQTAPREALGAMRSYFDRNPYKDWFRWVEELVQGFGWSLYAGSAAHTDVVSCFASRRPWSRLGPEAKTLLRAAGWETFLGVIKEARNVELIVVFGTTAYEALAEGSGASFRPVATPWDSAPKLRMRQPVLATGTWRIPGQREMQLLRVTPYMQGTPGAPLGYAELRRIPELVGRVGAR